jgi:serpin B
MWRWDLGSDPQGPSRMHARRLSGGVQHYDSGVRNLRHCTSSVARMRVAGHGLPRTHCLLTCRPLHSEQERASAEIRSRPSGARLALGIVLIMACGHAPAPTNAQANSSTRPPYATSASASAMPQILPSSTTNQPAGSPVLAGVDLARQAAAATNRFAFDLYQRERVSEGNLIVSPLSAAVALAMTAAGARGATYQEMARVLRLSEIADVDAAFQSLLSSLGQRSGEDGVILRLAQRLWGHVRVQFASDFRARLADRYGAPFGVVDFARPEPARIAINQWAARETNDRIRELLRPGEITGETRLVLANAVHFASRWRSRFDERATRTRQFVTAQGTVPAAMMHQLGRFAHAELPGLAILELPCLGDFSVIILLPDSVQGLAALEMQLGEHYETGLSRLAEKPIDLQLPRWKTTSAIRLEPALQAMGLSLAFGLSADFSAMAPAEPLHIGLVVQQASVEANEKGAEAAAATAVVMYGLALTDTPAPVGFRADHPFVYLIRDRTTGVILFVGRVSDPS